MNYNLFLDDERKPNNVTWVNLPLVNWTIVKNFNEFANIIKTRGLPKIVSFDHDLADQHYQEYQWAHDDKNTNKGIFCYNKMTEKTGFDCAKWLVEYCMAHDEFLPQYFIHTMNPIGAKNIASLFESFKKSHNID